MVVWCRTGGRTGGFSLQKAATMYQSLRITDFFKSFTQPRQNKRSSDCSVDDSRAAKHSRSSTPDNAASITSEHEPLEEDSGKCTKDNSNEPERKSSTTERIADSILHGCDGTEPVLPDTPPQKIEVQPSSSQGPVLMSSQRVIVNGEVVIKNSDDESDSEASLDDIDDLLGVRKPASALPSPTTAHPHGPISPNATERNGTVTRSKTKIATLTRARQPSSHVSTRSTYKFSLDSLKRQNKENAAAEAGSTEAWSLLDSVGEKAPREMTSHVHTPGAELIDADLVASVLKDKREEEDISKLMTAIHRTEAFDQIKSWSFFIAEEDETLSSNPPFPENLPMQWHETLSGLSSCRRLRSTAYTV